MELDRQNEQCAEFGYYEVTQGYRKIPGNQCTGGVDLSPYRYQCSTFGSVTRIFSLRNLFLAALVGALLFYGWPIIEAVLLLLPIPDPQDIKEKMSGMKNKAMNMVKKGKK